LSPGKLVQRKFVHQTVRRFMASVSESSDRPLAYVHTIEAIKPIPGADAIDLATVLGWSVIVKKGKYKPGDPVIYIEIDSVVPPWEYFKEDKLDRYNFRIRTITMRKQISQGYCVPLEVLKTHPTKKVELDSVEVDTPEGKKPVPRMTDLETKEITILQPGTDLTNFFGIKKYELPNSVNVNGEAAGSFPGFIPKTDQTRIQNLPQYPYTYPDVEFEVTEKLEGSSITAYFHNGQFGICSRNLSLRISDEADAVAVKTVQSMGIKQKLEKFGKSLALQGELVGPGVQANIYGLKQHMWRIFDVFLILEGRYATPEERLNILRDLGLGDSTVPILKPLKLGGMSVADILEAAEGKSALANVSREGIVFKSKDLVKNRVLSFKAISNSYELKKSK